MNIKVFHDKYIIRDDPYCYKLIELRPKNAKKEDAPEDEEIVETDGDYSEATVGYYSTLSYLIEDLMDREKRNNRCTTLEGFAKHLEKINKEAEAIVETLVKACGSRERLKEFIFSTVDHCPEDLKETPKPRGRKKGA